MEISSKDIRAKIRSLKSELSETKSYYYNQIYPLKQKESWTKQSVSLAIATKSTEQRRQKLQDLRNRINELEKERDEKIRKIEAKLNSVKDEYRKNYDKYKKDEQKARENKITDLKIYFDSHKPLVILSGIGVCIFIFLVITTIRYSLGVACPQDFIGLTINEATSLADRLGLSSDVWGETYDPEARDEQKVTFVSSVFNSDSSQNYDYNKFTDTKRRLKSGEKISFETQDKTAKQQREIEECKSKGENYRYKFNSGKVECYTEETEEEKKAKCEMSGKWYRDGLCKSQEEWESQYKWQDAHSACKKYGVNAYAKTLTDCYVGNDYMGTVDGQPANNADNAAPDSDSSNSNNPPATNNNNVTYKWKSFNDDGSCPTNVELCVAIDESVGYASYNYGNVRGRVYNNTDKNASYMQISFSVYNPAGAKIGDCYANTGGLNAGTTWSYDAYCTAWTENTQIKDADITWW